MRRNQRSWDGLGKFSSESHASRVTEADDAGPITLNSTMRFDSLP